MRRKLNMEKVHNPIYWKQVKSKLEAANTKEASIAFRKKTFRGSENELLM